MRQLCCCCYWVVCVCVCVFVCACVCVCIWHVVRELAHQYPTWCWHFCDFLPTRQQRRWWRWWQRQHNFCFFFSVVLCVGHCGGLGCGGDDTLATMRYLLQRTHAFSHAVGLFIFYFSSLPFLCVSDAGACTRCKILLTFSVSTSRFQPIQFVCVCVLGELVVMANSNILTLVYFV